MSEIDLLKLGPERRLESPELQARADQNRWSEYRLQFVAMEGKAEVGFLSFDLCPGEDHLVLYELFVEGRLRGRSYGRRLLAMAEGVARERGVSLLLIRPGQLVEDVSEDWLRGWYVSQGYQPWPRDPDVLAKDVRGSGS